jgi:hypothetical protein
MPAHFDRTIERTLAALPGLGEPLPEVPQTLVHGDFRLGNMMFGEPQTADEMVAFDWAGTRAGPSRWDLCYFLALNLPVALRRELEEPALRRYHATLTDGGVTGYSFDRCYEDYRLVLLLALFQPLGMEGLGLSGIEQLGRWSGESCSKRQRARSRSSSAPGPSAASRRSSTTTRRRCCRNRRAS